MNRIPPCQDSNSVGTYVRFFLGGHGGMLLDCPTFGRTAFRSVAVAVVGFAIAVVTSACGGGFSTEEAEARCDAEQEARDLGGCFDDVAYDECVVAYEECGSDVNIDDSCPLSFTCGD